MASGLDPDFFGAEINPYAPPTSQFEPPVPASPRASVPFDVGSILSATWVVYKEQLGSCMAVCVTVVVLTWGVQILQRVLLTGGLRPAPLGGNFLLLLAVFVGGYFFSIWLGIGQNLAMLAIARSEPGAFGWLWRGGRFVWTSILASILFTLAIGAIVLVNVIWIPIVTLVAGRGQPASVGILVMVVAVAAACIFGIFIATRLSQFTFLIIDKSAGVLDSLQWSWEATRGRAGTLIGVYSMLGLINLGGLLACCVGLLFTIPFTALALAVAYLSLTGQFVGGKPTPGAWDEISYVGD